MKKTIIVAAAVGLVLIAAWDLSPSASVTTPEVGPQRTEYRHPVREGNCWRQFTSTDSVLVCH
jgi:hypothetical protein